MFRAKVKGFGSSAIRRDVLSGWAGRRRALTGKSFRRRHCGAEKRRMADSQPLCVKCNCVMALADVEPKCASSYRYERRTFKCTGCGCYQMYTMGSQSLLRRTGTKKRQPRRYPAIAAESEDFLLAQLRNEVERAVSQSAWAKINGLHVSYVNKVLKKRQRPGPAIARVPLRRINQTQ